MSTNIVHHRVGGWLPKDHSVLENWLVKKNRQLESRRAKQPFAPVIQEFQQLIEGDASLKTLFEQMFLQIPNKPPYDKDPTQRPQIRTYTRMLELLNLMLTEAPEFNESGLVSLIGAILDRPMGTPSGFTAFYLPKVNIMFKKLLNEWAKFLSSPDSCYVLTTDEPGGWFGSQALHAMGNFDDFVHDKSAPYYGFRSWDDFFTRRFRQGARPLPESYDERIIVSGCESTVYNFVSDVKEHNLFWLKRNSYSLADMLDYHPYTPQFAGGTVYQAYLSATSYHRWNTPLNGTIVDIQMVSGTYFSESPVVGLDPSAPESSQEYLTSVATRAIIYIQADNPKIGLMCFMAVGMTEVSTCEVTVGKGDKVVQGDEIGMFHFGGSTYCLIFRPETKVEFTDNVKIGNAVKLNEPVGFVA